MRRIEQLLGMPIVSLAEGSRLGTVKNVEVDPAAGRIRYLHFNGDHRADGILPWDAIQAVGTDAITVESSASVLSTIPATERPLLTPVLGDRPVMTESGRRLGHVAGYEVDEVTGRIDHFRVVRDGLFGRFGRTVDFPQTCIRTVGKDAIIVADEVALDDE